MKIATHEQNFLMGENGLQLPVETHEEILQ